MLIACLIQSLESNKQEPTCHGAKKFRKRSLKDHPRGFSWGKEFCLTCSCLWQTTVFFMADKSRLACPVHSTSWVKSALHSEHEQQGGALFWRWHLFGCACPYLQYYNHWGAHSLQFKAPCIPSSCIFTGTRPARVEEDDVRWHWKGRWLRTAQTFWTSDHCHSLCAGRLLFWH